jgi:hypothetical protein
MLLVHMLAFSETWDNYFNDFRAGQYVKNRVYKEISKIHNSVIIAPRDFISNSNASYKCLVYSCEGIIFLSALVPSQSSSSFIYLLLPFE